MEKLLACSWNCHPLLSAAEDGRNESAEITPDAAAAVGGLTLRKEGGKRKRKEKKRIMQIISSPSLLPSPPRKFLPIKVAIGSSTFRKKQAKWRNSFLGGEERSVGTWNWKESRSRRAIITLWFVSSGLLVALSASGKVKSRSPYDEKRLLEQNKKMQEANNAPENFPNFIREGFQVKVVTSDNYVKRDSGLIYLDIQVGKGDCPKDGQQVTFHYIGYNESGRRIDSTYLQGAPAKIRLGNKALVPGFEEGIRDMRPGGKRRLIIPPELGPPVGPSTFFSAKQFEVFDVELLNVQDCQRRTIVFYSDVVCN